MNTSLVLKTVLQRDLEITITLNSFKFIRIKNPQQQTSKNGKLSFGAKSCKKLERQNVKECLERR